MVDSPPAYGTTQVNIPVSYMFYQLFLDHTIVHCRSAFDPADPFTGRFNARQLGSPNPIAVVEIRKHIASLENLDATTIESLYLSANDAEAVDGNLLVNSGSGNPGSSIHTPLAVVITTVETPSKPVLISGLEMSHTEPHKVASVTIPLGWRAGTCTHVSYLYKYIYTGQNRQIRWVGEPLLKGVALWVDRDNQNNTPIHTGTICRRVIVSNDRRLGYYPERWIEYERLDNISILKRAKDAMTKAVSFVKM